ncbi:MAG: hypothetical protein Athens101426_608, partial [Parcubacteria group bacterium Athens1014_26]
MKIIDAHCHIQFPAYDKDRDDVIKRAKQADVKMIVSGVDLVTSNAAVQLAEEH